jgi:hypothetical protein
MRIRAALNQIYPTQLAATRRRWCEWAQIRKACAMQPMWSSGHMMAKQHRHRHGTFFTNSS